MSYYLCNCGEKSYIFGKGGAKRTAEEMKVDFLGEIPLVEYIRESSDDGSPITVSEPESKYSLIFKEMAQKLDQKLSASKAKGNPKIIIE